MAMTYGYSLDMMIIDDVLRSAEKPYMIKAYDSYGDEVTDIGPLDLEEARFSGAREARERLQEALDNHASGMIFPPVRVEVLKVEKVATASINNEIETTYKRKLGSWNRV